MNKNLNEDSLLTITYTAKRFDLIEFKQITLETITIRKKDNTLIVKDGNKETIFKTKCDHNEIVELFNKVFDTVKNQKEVIMFVDDCSAKIRLTYSSNKYEVYDRGTCITEDETLENIILDFVRRIREC